MVVAAKRRQPSRAKKRYQAIGGAAEFMIACDSEVLYEGVANAGKTRAVCEKTHYLCSKIPGLRVLWVRKTRKSMTESVLVTFEEHVLPRHHPCIHGTASRAHRDSYEYPNGSSIVLGGMDNPDRIMSTEYDVIVYFEATEGLLREWEQLSTRVRNKMILVGVDEDGDPVYWDQMIADCNPGAKSHWLNKRARAGKMRRIRARHSDNPTFTKRDQMRLDALTGVRRKRLRDGEWVAAEGQVLENYDPERHDCYLHEWLWNRNEPSEGYKFDWYFAGLDFGNKHAQALEVFGAVGNEVVRVCEVYKRRMRYDWWGDAIEQVLDKWDIGVIVADNNDEKSIQYLNDRLGPLGGRDEGQLIIPADKAPGAKAARIQMVQDFLAEGRLKFAVDALEFGPCKVSQEEELPIGLLEELPDWVWAEEKPGMRAKDEPDPRCIDHGIDAMLYALGWAWGKDWSPEGRKYATGTLGEELDHASVWAAEEARERGFGADDEVWPEKERDEWGNLI
tara:strand:- start:874 stop:2388 length:1515 start_codon:yes stop_codon:yes gene_type:complete